MDMDGTVQQVDGGFVIRFERELSHPVETVWAALTRSQRISDWLGGPGSQIEPRVGGKVQLPAHGIESTVSAFETGRVIEFGWKTAEWDGGTVRWELSPAGGATHLELTHRNPPIDPEELRRLGEKFGWTPDMYDPIPRNLAGWHALLDALTAALEGDPPPAEDHWKPLHEHYKELHGSPS
jgi:uncharacterized protein YndB with AHSA1/START domain